MAKRLRALLTLAALAAAFARAEAMVAGTPDPPEPGPAPRWWIESGNDLFGIRGSGAPVDDFRTAEVAVGGCPGGSVAIAIDDSLLTDRARGTRTDELTASVGLGGGATSGRAGTWAAAGGGARRFGDLGGQRAQDALHAVLQNPRYQLTYDRGGTSGFVYALVEGWYARTAPCGCDGECSAAATAAGELESDLAVHVDGGTVIAAHRASGWIGVRWRGRDGSAPTPTSATVAGYERGARIDYGFAYRAVAVIGDWDPWRRRSYGAIAVIIRR